MFMQEMRCASAQQDRDDDRQDHHVDNLLRNLACALSGQLPWTSRARSVPVLRSSSGPTRLELYLWSNGEVTTCPGEPTTADYTYPVCIIS